MPAADPIKRDLCSFAQPPYSRCLAALVFSTFVCTTANAQSCPDLQPYYPAGSPAPQPAWQAVLPRLEAQLENCLQSAEYFALLGAAQLNTAQLSQALESLERALLIEPDNGAARIDYA